MQQWLRHLEIKGAAKGLPTLTDLLEPPPRKEPKSRLAGPVAAGIALLLAGGYWIVSHRNLLPSIESAGPANTPSTSPEPDSAVAPIVSTPGAAPPKAPSSREATATAPGTVPAAPPLSTAPAAPRAAPPAVAPRAAAPPIVASRAAAPPAVAARSVTPHAAAPPPAVPTGA